MVRDLRPSDIIPNITAYSLRYWTIDAVAQLDAAQVAAFTSDNLAALDEKLAV
jgi:hypothetical protein